MLALAHRVGTRSLSKISQQTSRHPRPKRTFEQIDESITYNDVTDSETIIVDDDDEPPLKDKGAILAIDILIEATKAELVETAQVFRRLYKAGMRINDPIWEPLNKLRRLRACLADVQPFILDREMESFVSGLLYAPLFALDCLIEENERQMEKVEQNSITCIKVEVFLDMHSSLERWHIDLMETRRYILDPASSDGNPKPHNRSLIRKAVFDC